MLANLSLAGQTIMSRSGCGERLARETRQTLLAMSVGTLLVMVTYVTCMGFRQEVDDGLGYIRARLGAEWVIPNQFSKRLQVTPSELDETWFVSSTCGFMKPDKMLLSYVVWLPDYSPSKIHLFLDFCLYSNYSNPHNFLILDCFVILMAPS